MPLGAVKYEDLWERAKAQITKSYPDVKHGTSRYWSLVMGLYKAMERARDAKK